MFDCQLWSMRLKYNVRQIYALDRVHELTDKASLLCASLSQTRCCNRGVVELQLEQAYWDNRTCLVRRYGPLFRITDLLSDDL